MSVTIKDNTRLINRDISLKANLFLRFAADEVIKISKPKTPKKTGELRRSILREVLGLKGKIRWLKNYAVYQERKQFKNYTTAGTGPHFAENAIKKVVKRTRTIARRVGLS